MYLFTWMHVCINFPPQLHLIMLNVSKLNNTVYLTVFYKEKNLNEFIQVKWDPALLLPTYGYAWLHPDHHVLRVDLQDIVQVHRDP